MYMFSDTCISLYIFLICTSLILHNRLLSASDHYTAWPNLKYFSTNVRSNWMACNKLPNLLHQKTLFVFGNITSKTLFVFGNTLINTSCWSYTCYVLFLHTTLHLNSCYFIPYYINVSDINWDNIKKLIFFLSLLLISSFFFSRDRQMFPLTFLWNFFPFII